MSKIKDIWAVLRGQSTEEEKRLFQENLELVRRINRISDHILTTANDIHHIRNRINVMESALGRIVAKLDPYYLTPEDDPQRIAESKRLGEEAIHRLRAEDLARRHTTGES